MTMFDSEGREWISHWAGDWSLLSCCYFGEQYTLAVKDYLGVSVPHALFFSSKGRSKCLFPKEELEDFGRALAEKVMKNPQVAQGWCAMLKRRTDCIRGIVATARTGRITSEIYLEFISALYDYVSPHIAVKKVVDYLSQESLKGLLPAFQDARLYSEPVYTESEEFMRLFAAQVAAEKKCPAELVLCLKPNEVTAYFETGKLPDLALLRARFCNSAIVCENGKYEMLIGEKATGLDDRISGMSAKDLKGQTAYPGFVKGFVRIVIDPVNATFNEGEILVTGMTRPEYIPLMKKASAVVTDAGGILCHAAIVCRELKIPGVVGTQNATRLLKDGDLVEVDAAMGIIRKV